MKFYTVFGISKEFGCSMADWVLGKLIKEFLIENLTGSLDRFGILKALRVVCNLETVAGLGKKKEIRTVHRLSGQRLALRGFQ